MKRFFDLTFKPFFVITGIGTAAATLFAFWPRWATETAGKIPFASDYTIIIQHWGIMVGLMGAFMIAAALNSNGESRFSSTAFLKKPSWFIDSGRLCLFCRGRNGRPQSSARNTVLPAIA